MRGYDDLDFDDIVLRYCRQCITSSVWQYDEVVKQWDMVTKLRQCWFGLISCFVWAAEELQLI